MAIRPGPHQPGFSDDLGDWPGRYFIQSYDSIFVSAFPSLAYRIDDRWSVAASAAIQRVSAITTPQ